MGKVRGVSPRTKEEALRKTTKVSKAQKERKKIEKRESTEKGEKGIKEARHSRLPKKGEKTAENHGGLREKCFP